MQKDISLDFLKKKKKVPNTFVKSYTFIEEKNKKKLCFVLFQPTCNFFYKKIKIKLHFDSSKKLTWDDVNDKSII